MADNPNRVHTDDSSLKGMDNFSQVLVTDEDGFERAADSTDFVEPEMRTGPLAMSYDNRDAKRQGNILHNRSSHLVGMATMR